MAQQEKHTEIWDNCLQIISQIVEPQQYKVWFRPIRAVSFADSKLTLEVPSLYFQEYVESAFLDVLRMTLRRVIGEGAQLCYKVRPVQNHRTRVRSSIPVSTRSRSTPGSTRPIASPTWWKVSATRWA